MNKKLLSVVLSATCVIALAACGGSKVNDAVVLADAEHVAYCIAGPGQTKVGGESIDWDYTEAGVMTASSRNDLKAVSQDLYDDLKAVKLSALYIIEDVVIGAEAAGYNKTAMLGDAIVQADGALTLKTISVKYDAEDGVYFFDEWLPSPEVYGESLTPDLYWCPPHYETPDANGFHHNSDAVVVGGAGTYTIILARYSTVNTRQSRFGIGFVLQEANPDGQQVAEIVSEDLTSLGAIGSFAASAGWSTEAALVKNANGVWEGSVEAVADDEFKVRANGAWSYAWGFDAVTEVAAGVIVDSGGNIKAVAAGTYNISIVAPAKLSLISNALTSFEITFVPAVAANTVTLNPVTLLGYESTNVAYTTVEATHDVGSVTFGVTNIGCFGTGLQFKKSAAPAALLRNTTAFETAITKIEFEIFTGKAGYDNTDVAEFKFGTSADLSEAVAVKVSTVKDQLVGYSVTPNVVGATYFSFGNPNQTLYLASIIITLA